MRLKNIEKAIKIDANNCKYSIKQFDNKEYCLHCDFGSKRRRVLLWALHYSELYGIKDFVVIRSACKTCVKEYKARKIEKLDEKDIFTIKILLPNGTTN